MKDNQAPAPKATTTVFFMPASKPTDTPGLRPDWMPLGELVSAEIKVDATSGQGAAETHLKRI